MITTGGGPVYRITYEKEDIEEKKCRVRWDGGRASGLNIESKQGDNRHSHPLIPHLCPNTPQRVGFL